MVICFQPVETVAHHLRKSREQLDQPYRCRLLPGMIIQQPLPVRDRRKRALKETHDRQVVGAAPVQKRKSDARRWIRFR